MKTLNVKYRIENLKYKNIKFAESMINSMMHVMACTTLDITHVVRVTHFMGLYDLSIYQINLYSSHFSSKLIFNSNFFPYFLCQSIKENPTRFKYNVSHMIYMYPYDISNNKYFRSLYFNVMSL